MKNKILTKLGIDEAGRGPLAGPVSVAVFGMRQGFSLKGFPKGRDSKKMSEVEREKWFEIFLLEKKKGNVFFEIAFGSSSVIDSKGIVPAINSATEKCLLRLEKEKIIKAGKGAGTTEILLDGALHAPARYLKQKTIIKGDEKEKLIACASIVAKVSRDRYMKRMSKTYPQYLFEVHKGYGTTNHRRLIELYGLSHIHRKSFCRNYRHK